MSLKELLKTESKPKKWIAVKTNIFKRNKYWLLLLTVVILVAYYPTFNNGFTNFDDERYVTQNKNIRSLSGKSIKTIFTTYYDGHYHPLTMISLAIDHKISKNEPSAYHLTNLIIHILNTILLFIFIYLLANNLQIAFITALLFGIHPINVESVAWVSERKNLLFGFFFILSLINYTKYIKFKQNKYYTYSLIFFLLSIMSKVTAISLVVTLIAIDYLFARNLLCKKVIYEKIPFFLLAIFFALIASFAQKTTWTDLDQNYSFYELILFSGYSFIQYILKLIAPYNLSAFYPYPDDIGQSINFFYWVAPLVAIILVGFVAYLIQKRSKYFVFGALFFMINIFLLLKLFNIPYGKFIMADRYTYIPSIGFFFIIGYGYKILREKYFKNRQTILSVFICVAILFTYLTNKRTRIWHDSISLWTDVIEKYPDYTHAWNMRGMAKGQMGNISESINDFKKSIELDPDLFDGYLNIGIIKIQEKKYKAAIPYYDKAIKLKPDLPIAFFNRGMAKYHLKDWNNAISDLDQAIKLDNKFDKAYALRGNLKLIKKEYNEAINDFNEVIKLSPLNAQILYNRGTSKVYIEEFEAAIKDFDKVLEINPRFEGAFNNRKYAFEQLNLKTGRNSEEVKKDNITSKDFETFFKKGARLVNSNDFIGGLNALNKAIEINSNNARAFSNRGYVKSKLNDLKGAIQDYSKAIKIDPNLPLPYFLRGMANIALNKKAEGCEDLKKADMLGFPEARREIQRYCGK